MITGVQANFIISVLAVPEDRVNINYDDVIGTGSYGVKVYKGCYDDADVAVKVMPFLLEDNKPSPEVMMHM